MQPIKIAKKNTFVLRFFLEKLENADSIQSYNKIIMMIN